jgi:hypothetical protein
MECGREDDYSCPPIPYQIWTALFFQQCSSLLGEAESMWMAVQWSITFHYSHFVFDRWNCLILSKMRIFKKSGCIFKGISRINSWLYRGEHWHYLKERAVNLYIQTINLWSFFLVRHIINNVQSMCMRTLRVIYGPPAKCNTRELGECSTLLHSAYTRDFLKIVWRNISISSGNEQFIHWLVSENASSSLHEQFQHFPMERFNQSTPASSPGQWGLKRQLQ